MRAGHPDENEHRLEHQIDIRQGLTIGVSVDGKTLEVFATASAALRDVLVDVVRIGLHRGHDIFENFVPARREEIRPLEELCVICFGEAHQLANHEHRKWSRDVSNEVWIGISSKESTTSDNTHSVNWRRSGHYCPIPGHCLTLLHRVRGPCSTCLMIVTVLGDTPWP